MIIALDKLDHAYIYTHQHMKILSILNTCIYSCIQHTYSLYILIAAKWLVFPIKILFLVQVKLHPKERSESEIRFNIKHAKKFT